jgi:hypothetical protein
MVSGCLQLVGRSALSGLLKAAAEHVTVAVMFCIYTPCTVAVLILGQFVA